MSSKGTVGIVGLGIMGGAMARNLMERGWQVVGFDTDPQAVAALAGPRFTAAADAAAVAGGAELVITSLPSPKAALATARAIAAGGTPARVVCETSTLSLADKEAFAAILANAGHVALDCPLSAPARRPLSGTSSSTPAARTRRSPASRLSSRTSRSSMPMSGPSATAAS